MTGLPFLNIVIISDRHCSILLVSSVNPFESCSHRRPTDKESLSSHCGHTHARAQLIKSRTTLKKLHRNGMVKWMDGWTAWHLHTLDRIEPLSSSSNPFNVNSATATNRPTHHIRAKRNDQPVDWSHLQSQHSRIYPSKCKQIVIRGRKKDNSTWQ